MPEDIPIVTGAPDPGQIRRLGPLSGAKPKQPRYELPIRPTPGPGRLVPCARIQLVTDRFAFEMPTPTYPGPGTGTQPVTDRFAYELTTWTRTQPVLDRLMDYPPDMPNSVPGYDRLPPKAEVHDSIRSPETDFGGWRLKR